jgi:hypothetical protein
MMTASTTSQIKEAIRNKISGATSRANKGTAQ